MNRLNWITCAAALLAIAGVAPAHGGVVLEFDYRQSEDPSFVSAPGASDEAVLIGDTTHSTGAAVGGVTNPLIRNGFIDVPDDTAGPTVTGGMETSDTGGGNHNFDDYMPQGNQIGSGSFTVVYRPNWSGSPTRIYRLLFTYGSTNNTETISLSFQQFTGGRLSMAVVNENGPDTANIEDVVVDDETWYLITGTWREDTTGLTASDPRIALYMRPISPEGVLQSSTYTGDLASYAPGDSNGLDQPIQIGHTDIGSNAPGEESADGQIAYVRIGDSFVTEAQFGELYDTLLPEPASITLLLAGAGLMLGRRH